MSQVSSWAHPDQASPLALQLVLLRLQIGQLAVKSGLDVRKLALAALQALPGCLLCLNGLLQRLQLLCLLCLLHPASDTHLYTWLLDEQSRVDMGLT